MTNDQKTLAQRLLNALIEVRQVSGCAMDYGNNDDAVHKCYKISRDAVSEYCMEKIVRETEALGGYSESVAPAPKHGT